MGGLGGEGGAGGWGGGGGAGREAERRRDGEAERESSSGGVAAPRGAVAVMGELSNGPLSKLPSEHHVTTRD